MSIREVDRVRAERYLADGRSWAEIEALIPGIDLAELRHPSEEDEAIIKAGRRASQPEYVRGRLVKMMDQEGATIDDKLEILVQLLRRT